MAQRGRNARPKKPKKILQSIPKSPYRPPEPFTPVSAPPSSVVRGGSAGGPAREVALSTAQRPVSLAIPPQETSSFSQDARALGDRLLTKVASFAGLSAEGKDPGVGLNPPIRGGLEFGPINTNAFSPDTPAQIRNDASKYSRIFKKSRRITFASHDSSKDS